MNFTGHTICLPSSLTALVAWRQMMRTDDPGARSHFAKVYDTHKLPCTRTAECECDACEDAVAQWHNGTL